MIQLKFYTTRQESYESVTGEERMTRHKRLAMWEADRELNGGEEWMGSLGGEWGKLTGS